MFDTLITRLETAINSYSGDVGPGRWSLEVPDDEPVGNLYFVYIVRETSATPGLAQLVSELDDNVFFEQWGGDYILLAAALMVVPGSAISCFLSEVEDGMECAYSVPVRSFAVDALPC
jgi:hypothetical protein